jgi:hypothetical protein
MSSVVVCKKRNGSHLSSERRVRIHSPAIHQLSFILTPRLFGVTIQAEGTIFVNERQLNQSDI